MKKDLRNKYLKKRNNLAEKHVLEASEEIYRIFFDSRFADYDSFMLFKSFGKEISVDLILTELQKQGKTTVIPTVTGEKMMKAVRVHHNTRYITDSFGIPTPVSKEYVPSKNCALILVPGVVFDETGGRLGRGKGFYDRFLAKTDGALKLGVSYEFQVLEKIEYLDAHDIEMDYIMTEKGIRSCK